MSLFTVVKLILAVGILIFIIMKVGITSIGEVALTAQPVFLILGILALLFSLLLNAFNLKIMLRPLGTIGLKSMFRHYTSAWALGLVTPGKIGEFSISVFLKDRIPIGRSAAVFLMERMISIFVLIVFSISGFFLFFDFLTALTLVAAFLVAWMMGVALLFSDFGRKLIRRYILRKYARIFEGFSDTFMDYIRMKKKYIAFAFALAAARWIVNSVIVYLLFLTFLQPVDFVILLGIVPLSSVVSLIPVTVSGLGLREGVFIFFTSQMGINAALSATVSLFILAMNYSIVLISLLILVKRTNLKDSLEELRGKAEQ